MKEKIKKINEKELIEKEEKSSLRTIAKGALFVIIGSFLGKFIAYFYVMFVARLGTEKFGLLNIGSTVASLFVTIALLGLDSGLLRYIAYYKGKKDKPRIKSAILSSLKICVPLSILFTALIFIFSEQISLYVFHNAQLVPILRIFSFLIPFSVLSTIFFASLRAFKRADYAIGLTEVVEKGVRLLIAFFLIKLGFDIAGASYSFIISMFVVFVIAFLIHEKKIFPILTKIKPKYYTKELLHFSLPLMFSGIMLFIISWIDTLMLGYFKDASQVGIYNAAHTTGALVFIIPTAMLYLFLPIITGLYSQKKTNEIKDLFKKVSKWVFIVNFPVFLIIAFFPKQVINIIFGADYIVGSTALIILSCSYLLYSLSFTSNNIISMAKKTKLIFWITLIFAGSSVLLNFLLIPKYGFNGAAIATATSFVIGAILITFFSARIIKLIPLTKSLIKPLLAGIISIGIIYFLFNYVFDSSSVFNFMIMFLSFIILYASFIFLFKAVEKEDLAIIKRFISNNKLINNKNNSNNKI